MTTLFREAPCLVEIQWLHEHQNDVLSIMQVLLQTRSIWHESDGWGFGSPLGSRHFLSQNFDTFTRTSLQVENECCYPRTVNIWNCNFTSKMTTNMFNMLTAMMIILVLWMHLVAKLHTLVNLVQNGFSTLIITNTFSLEYLKSRLICLCNLILCLWNMTHNSSKSHRLKMLLKTMKIISMSS